MNIIKLLGLIVVFLDGLFHFFSSQSVIMKYSPDWIISTNIFNKQGMDISSHRTIGLYLIISSLYLLYSDYKNNNNYDIFYSDIVIPIVIITIIIGLLIKIYNNIFVNDKFTNFYYLLNY